MKKHIDDFYNSEVQRHLEKMISVLKTNIGRFVMDWRNWISSGDLFLPNDERLIRVEFLTSK